MKFASAALVGALILGGCQAGSETASGADKYAGLDAAIRDWHVSIKASDKLCAAGADAQACQDFQVACKGDRPLTSDDAAKGLTARVIAAMSWQARDGAEAEYKPASSVVEFTKVGGEWKRAQTGPVNLTTCA